MPDPTKSKIFTQVSKVKTQVNKVTKLATRAVMNLPVVSRLSKTLALKPKARVPKLMVQTADDLKPQVYNLVGDRYIIGRSSSKSDIVVKTPLVSQVHAKLVRDSSQKKAKFIIKDQGSTNGIYRKRQRLKSAPLRHNTVISLGPPELKAAVTVRFVDPPPWYMRALIYSGYGVAGIVGLFIAALAIELQRVPDLKPLPVSQQGPVEVLAGDNQTSLGPAEVIRHTELRELEEFGEFVPQAIIASEDSSFYFNIGVDPVGIARAVVTNVQSGELREGGSTITQQLARNLLGRTYVGRDDSLGRKWREAAAAIKLTFTYPKDEILAIYLNRIYMGNGAYGLQDAALLYFGKPAKELTLSEAATLAGLVPAPEAINPFYDKDLSLEYRDRVLNRMVDLGMIKEDEAERARRSILRLNEEARQDVQSAIAPYYYSYVFEEMEAILGENFAFEGNLIVETSLDLNMQKQAIAALQRSVNGNGASFGYSQGAVVTTNTSDGAILALVGGVDYDQSQFNRVSQSQRQPGSTFKLFTYTAAIDQGISPNRTFSCSPAYGIGGCSNGGSGNINMYDGFAFSENVVAVRVAESVGFNNVIRMARNLGITAELEPNTNVVLGGYEVNMLEMAAAYGAIANRGKYIKPHAIRRILDSQDCEDYQNYTTCRVIFDAAIDAETRQAIDPAVADTMLEIMRGVVQYGTGRAAAIPQATVFGKTGTTDSSRDLWFIGFVPQRQILTAVWLGNDEGTTSGSSSLAASLWGDYMSQALP
jgi:1A family penicillin-binding protein